MYSMLFLESMHILTQPGWLDLVSCLDTLGGHYMTMVLQHGNLVCVNRANVRGTKDASLTGVPTAMTVNKNLPWWTGPIITDCL
jgi:hypothetical protein